MNYDNFSAEQYGRHNVVKARCVLSNVLVRVGTLVFPEQCRSRSIFKAAFQLLVISKRSESRL